MKKLFTLLLMAALFITLLPLTVSAASPAAWDGITIDVSWYNSEDDTFYIGTPEQFAGLAAIVNGIYNKEITNVIGSSSFIVDNTSGESESDASSQNKTTEQYHYGADDFNGKTVYLTADLDMGGRYDTATREWSGPNYMPLGGQYLMELNNSDTKLGSSFCGVLDGQGHTIYNIYCYRHCSIGNYGDGQSVGLIGRLGVHDDDPAATRPVDPAVRNLAITGYIYANRSVGGIVGKIGKTSYNNGDGSTGAIVENCANFATVSNTDAKGCGGIVGASWNGGVVRNCYNAGYVSTTYFCPTGGIVGSNEIVVKNCYNIGTISATRDSYAMAIGTNNGSGTQVDNCYWLTGSAPGGGYYGKADGAVTELTADEMKNAAFLEKLGGAFITDANGINSGYPILAWQENAVTHTPPEPTNYSDVSDNAWYAAAADYVIAEGLFDLTGQNTFSPDAPMTRLMLVEALYRLSGSPEVKQNSVFTDSESVSVIWAYQNGVVNGTSDTTFSPNASITREQIAVMMYRYTVAFEGDVSATGALAVFSDSGSISNWAQAAMSWAVGIQMINGMGDGTVAPLDTATRAQVAQIVMNYTAL